MSYEPFFGWMLPNGEVLTCPRWKHLETLVNHPWTQIACADEIADVDEELTEIRLACTALGEAQGDSNAEWHRYEMACDERPATICRAAMRVGAIRLGSVEPTLQSQPWTPQTGFWQPPLCAEGQPEWLLQLNPKLKTLAAELRRELHLEPMRGL